MFGVRIARNIRNGTAGKSVCGWAVITAMCRRTGSALMEKRGAKQVSEWKVPVQSLIDHIKTAVDVDPWAKKMVEELLKEQEEEIENLKQTAQSMMEGICLLKEQEAEARLLTAEEVKNMEAGTAFGIETYYDHDGERMPGCAWALRTERLILSFFGTMFPDTVTKIPYNTLEMNQNTGKHEKHQYRFWSKKPTFEQCKAVKWE